MGRSTGFQKRDSESFVLAVGPTECLNALPLSDVNYVVVEISGNDACWGLNTLHIDFQAKKTLRCTTKDYDRVEEIRIDRMFSGLRLAPAFRRVLVKLGVHDPSEFNSWVPLFAKVSRDEHFRVFSQVRFRGFDALLIRTSPDVERVNAEAPDAWIDVAQCRHRQRQLFVSNHQKYYTKCLSDKEIEAKFTISADSEIATLAVDVHARIQQGQMSGYILEYGDEFQRWDYPSRMFEVTEPQCDRGYIAFIPTTDNRWLVKQKRFAEDSLVRGESISAPLVLADPIEEYVRNRALAYRRLPAFRRVRYDVNLESINSGHVYGIFFDRVAIVGAPSLRLSQCEVEYLRSRVAIDPSVDRIWQEMEEIRAFVRNFLEGHQIPFQEGYYSKLSFLREHYDVTLRGEDPSIGVVA